MRTISKVLLSAILLTAILIISCKGESFPTRLIIDGLTSDFIKGDIVTIRETGKKLIFTVKADSKEVLIAIKPWTRMDIFPGLSYTIEARQYHESWGPIRFVKLYHETNLIALFCENVKNLPAPFHQIQLYPGNNLKGENPTNRQWVDVIYKNSGSEKILLPGKPYTIKIDGKPWILFIFGASIPQNNEMIRKSESDPLVGEKEKIAGEEPGFTLDCVFYQPE